MRIALGTIEVSDSERRAIAHYYGERGLASRERCRNFIVRNGTGAILDQEIALQEVEQRGKSNG